MNKNLKLLLSLIPVFILACGIFLYFKNSKGFLLITTLYVIVLITYLNRKELLIKISDFLFHYRWPLFFILVFILTAFKVSGSSIGVFDEIFPTQIISKETTIFGYPRWIRSDEFGVSTLKHFSQAFNNYSLFSNQFSISKTNMLIDYYSPSLSLSIIGKPFVWGYLFGNEYGLSFNWLLINGLLFMMAFEMFFIITKNNKIESLIGAILIFLAPANQWWIMPHMPILVVYIMSLFVIGYYFFVGKTKLIKIGTCILSIMAIVGYALSIFPAYQVGLLYVVLPLFVVILYRDKEKIQLHKIDILRIIVVVVASLTILCISLYESYDAIKALNNTIYPGNRLILGGNAKYKDIFYDLSNLFISFEDINYSNNSEISSYFHLGPLCLLLSIRVLAFLRKKDRREFYVGFVQILVILIFSIFMYIGFPEIIAKITFFKYIKRSHLIFGFACVVFSIWTLSLLNKYCIFKKIEKIIYPLIFILFYCLTVDNNLINYLNSFSTDVFQNKVYLFLTAELLTILFISYLFVYKKTNCYFMYYRCL